MANGYYNETKKVKLAEKDQSIWRVRQGQETESLGVLVGKCWDFI